MEKSEVEVFSWRNREYTILPDVIDQGKTNACIAISIMIILESRYRLSRHMCKYHDYKELTLEHYLFNHDDANALKAMGNMEYNIHWFRVKGVPFREYYPCAEVPQLCLGNSFYLDPRDPIYIASKVARCGPVLLTFPVFSQFYNLEEDKTLIYRGEGQQIFVGDGNKREPLRHATVIVGFEKVDGVVKYFEFQNHNGPNWCNEGFGRIAVDNEFFTQCRIIDMYPVRDKKEWPYERMDIRAVEES